MQDNNQVSFPVNIKHAELIVFAKHMDKVLCENDHKGGWEDCDVRYLQYRLVEEMGEYFALASRGTMARGESYKKELIDIANFAMMLWTRS